MLDGLGFKGTTLRLVLDAMPLSVAIVSGERTYLFGNMHFCEAYGISQGDIIGKSTRLIFCSDEDYEALGRVAGPVITRGDTYDAEHTLQRSDGTTYLARAIGRLLDPDNPSLGTIWVVDDLSEHKIARYIKALGQMIPVAR
jgi:PAS domain S-box-containing protein